ncbi:MAG TPA: HAMP domain-containing protein, partial [Marmoricola sp.]
MRRLLVVYGSALTAGLLVALLVPLGLLAATLAHDRAMTAARQEAQGLTVIAAGSVGSQLREAVQALNHGLRRTTVFLPGGSTVGAPARRSPSVELASRGRAFTAVAAGGEQVLLPVAGRGGVAVIRTFVPESQLRAGVAAAWTTLAVVGLVLLGTAAVVGAAVARRLSRSVTELADVAARVSAGELTATVQPSGPPEVASVGRVLNGLGARIVEMLSKERALSADLSHRLRTPVTALRLDAESLADPGDRARMTRHVETLTTAVDAAVNAARHPGSAGTRTTCDAATVVRDRAAF